MTTATQTEVRLPPRTIVRVLWVLHRAMYRLTGRGLGQPKAGGRFGMLRLHTIGRRSAKERRTIIGYYEDGANLVAIAMNGWGHSEPDWWLNLQAHPDTTVDLANGSREVHARLAVGDERERLWQGLRNYSGWGDDIDALAAHRHTETAVVVLEPRESRGTS
jgi:deazaflavin-dependent oxidoreductase (nitroreductase family)